MDNPFSFDRNAPNAVKIAPSLRALNRGPSVSSNAREMPSDCAYTLLAESLANLLLFSACVYGVYVRDYALCISAAFFAYFL